MRISVFFIPALLLAQTPQSTTKSTAAPKAAPAAPAAGNSSPATGTAAFMTDEQKTIYALGLDIYSSIAGFNLSTAELDLVKKGLSDAMANKPQVDVTAYRPRLPQLYQARVKAAGAAFLAKAAAQPGAVKLPSGLVYKEERPGTGASPKPSDKVKVNYRGTFPNGVEFDSSYKTGKPAEFLVTGVIACWTEALQKMKVGGKTSLVCPPEIAYGDRGNPPAIPGGSTLAFEVELLEIEPPAGPPAAK